MTRHGMILSAMCGLDLTITLVGLKTSWWSGEINPVLAWFLIRWGLIGLAGAKIFFNAATISILEIVYRSGKIPQRKFIKYMRLTIFAYLSLFIGGLVSQLFLY